jgi:hypothetical protein
MLRLASGISFCAVEDRYVFLDIRADRYFCLTEAGDAAFRAWLADPDQVVAQTRSELLDSGLLEDGPARPTAPWTPPAAPRASLLDQDLPPASFGAGLLAAQRISYARIRLRLAGLERSLAHYGRAKRRARLPDAAALPQCAAVAAAFSRAGQLRSSLDTCLVHSLAVAHALAARGAAAELVIGVRLGPFAAHSWVQQGELIVNDRLDMVRTFTPIMVV